MPQEERTAIRGAVPVLVMPFHDNGTIDTDSLCRQIDFCLEAGAQAIAFGWGSESQLLSETEREQVWRAASAHINGSVPLIAATAHADHQTTVSLTRLALECGADCAMVNPDPRQDEELMTLFRDLSEQVPLPLMIQDAGGNAPVEVLLRVVREAPRVNSLKIECPDAPSKIGQIVASLSEMNFTERPQPEVTVLGGSNGHHLLEELEHGSVGTLPHPAIIDAYRTVCDLYASGAVIEAGEIYRHQIQPLNQIIVKHGGSMIWVHKWLFERAGILGSTYCRVEASPPPDEALTMARQHLEQTGLLIDRRRGK